MNDLDRLRLLERTLLESSLDEASNLGRLANDIESLCSSIEGCESNFSSCYSSLWAALEVVALTSFELGAPIQQTQQCDLSQLVSGLLTATRAELNRRNS
ncbi:hypothetical protein [Niveibacterium sp. COAC-50]|uniref:hypothetical protein n=1 Tax=Niveibacterium sp. COAC-50 TaxID=2729384 RepID=UPI0015531A98|nr:hypothetical protein [Niveibacterium sp. COAC-50]